MDPSGIEMLNSVGEILTLVGLKWKDIRVEFEILNNTMARIQIMPKTLIFLLNLSLIHI